MPKDAKRQLTINFKPTGDKALVKALKSLARAQRQLEHITKKQNKHRTFIILDQEERKRACDEKFDYHYNLTGKNVVIVDDTIVRGNIIKSIIKNLQH